MSELFFCEGESLKRLDLKTGFLCNNNCLFCVQADNKLKGNRSLSELKKDLDESRSRCDEVVLTGGEVTIRKDFFELVAYAKKIGYKNIQIQSNGRMFADLEFCKKTIEAGATEFSPALHGYCAEQHDYLTQAKGAFNQTVKGIMNLKKLGQKVITNTVIVKSNYRNAEDIAKLLVKLGVDQYQLAFVHPIGNAYKNFNSTVPVMTISAPYIHKGLDVGIKAGVSCMAEAMPYCMMSGYENHVSERVIPHTRIRGKSQQNTDDFLSQKKTDKTLFEQCNTCIRYEECEGVWKEYSQKFGEEEFKPIK